jgi:hypothetical protein
MNKLLLIILLLLSSVLVTANNEYKLNDISCYGDMLIQVNNVEGSNNYTFKNCLQTSDILWDCSCSKPPVLYNTLNETTIISFRIQYNIKQPRPIITSNPTHPISDEIYNEQLKRVITKTVTLTKDETIKSNNLFNNVGGVVIWIIVILLIVVIGLVVFIIKFLKSDDSNEKIVDEKTQKEIDELIKNL